MKRRTLLMGGAAIVAAAPVALATHAAAVCSLTEADPIFPLIATVDAARVTLNNCRDDIPDVELEILGSALIEAEWNVITTEPTTPAGLIALIEFGERYETDDPGSGLSGSSSEEGSYCLILLATVKRAASKMLGLEMAP